MHPIYREKTCIDKVIFLLCHDSMQLLLHSGRVQSNNSQTLYRMSCLCGVCARATATAAKPVRSGLTVLRYSWILLVRVSKHGGYATSYETIVLLKRHSCMQAVAEFLPLEYFSCNQQKLDETRLMVTLIIQYVTKPETRVYKLSDKPPDYLLLSR